MMMAGSSNTGWEHVLEPLEPGEVAPLQQTYLESLPIPTLTYLDLRLRSDLDLVGVKVDGRPVAFSLVARQAPDDVAGPMIVALAAPGQSSIDLRYFLQAVVEKKGVRSLWGRSDDGQLLEVLMLEGWSFTPVGPLMLLETPPAFRPPGLDIRPLEHYDFSQVLSLMSTLSEEERGGRGDAQEVRRLLNDQVLDGLFVNGRLRAVSQLHPQYSELYVSLEILVEPSFRQRGLGKWLAASVAGSELDAGRRVLATFGSDLAASRRLVESIGGKVGAVYYLARRE